jgi:hypothetical protein
MSLMHLRIIQPSIFLKSRSLSLQWSPERDSSLDLQGAPLLGKLLTMFASIRLAMTNTLAYTIVVLITKTYSTCP